MHSAVAPSRLHPQPGCLRRINFPAPVRIVGRQHWAVVSCSAQKQGGSEEEAAPLSAAASQLYRLMSSPHSRQSVGSHHGEGFLHVRPAGGTFKLDVDELNEQLKHQGALRLRHSMKPDEAFGMVFDFDGVVADVPGIQQTAWRALADLRDLPLAPGAESRPELLSMVPEDCILHVLGWSSERRDAQRLAYELAGLTSELLAALTQPASGSQEWLTALTNFNVPCALVSRLDKPTVRRVLERMCLHDHFGAMATAEDEAETISQRLLSACMKLARPPNMSVAFVASPEAITAAHNCSMKAVGVQGVFPAYQLKQADVIAGSLSELAVYNMRRLFANSGAELMDLHQEQQPQDPPRRTLRNALLPGAP